MPLVAVDTVGAGRYHARFHTSGVSEEFSWRRLEPVAT